MSLHAYHYSRKLGLDDPPFYALIMAAMRKADSDNLELLKKAFPEIWQELHARYNAPLGVLEEELPTVDMEVLQQQVNEMMATS
jgi:hypothetical protein